MSTPVYGCVCVCVRAHAVMYSVYNGEFVFLVCPLYLETDRPFLRLLFILMGNWLLIGCYHPRSSSRASSASKLTRANTTPTHEGGPIEGLEGRGVHYPVTVTSQTDLFQTWVRQLTRLGYRKKVKVEGCSITASLSCDITKGSGSNYRPSLFTFSWKIL